MNKLCTSLEQSKKLIELRIDVNTADMYWWYSEKDTTLNQWMMMTLIKNQIFLLGVFLL